MFFQVLLLKTVSIKSHYFRSKKAILFYTHKHNGFKGTIRQI